MFIEGVHFLRETHKPAEAGRKALVRSLSDIAAMGGAPRFCLVSLCVPAWAEQPSGWINFSMAFWIWPRATGTVLAGGDLSHGEKLACDVTVCGAVPRGTALRRDGARPGDEIYVSGALGGSALGPGDDEGQSAEAASVARTTSGIGRVPAREAARHFGHRYQRRSFARSAAALSGVRSDAEIVAPPRFPGASLEQSLHGGEEYELLFTVRGRKKVPAEFEGTAADANRQAIGARALPEKVTILEGAPLPPMGLRLISAAQASEQNFCT